MRKIIKEIKKIHLRIKDMIFQTGEAHRVLSTINSKRSTSIHISMEFQNMMRGRGRGGDDPKNTKSKRKTKTHRQWIGNVNDIKLLKSKGRCWKECSNKK